MTDNKSICKAANINELVAFYIIVKHSSYSPNDKGIRFIKDIKENPRFFVKLSILCPYISNAIRKLYT